MPTYPFTLHFDEPGKTKSAAQNPWRLVKGELTFASAPTISIVDVDSVRNAFDHLLATSQEYEYVATFALGGVTPLIYVTTALFEGTGATPAVDYHDLQRRFHLFAGPNWEFNHSNSGGVNTYNVAALFSAWLNRLPPNSRILVFDTGNIGNGANRAYNILHDHFQNPDSVQHERVLVYGLLSLMHQEKWVIVHRQESIPSADDGATEIEIAALSVSSNIFEDVTNLVGYDSLRNLGVIRPLKSSSQLQILEADGTPSGLGTANISGAFYGLLRRNLAYRLLTQPYATSTTPQEGTDVEQP